jgi:hypothetical protein
MYFFYLDESGHIDYKSNVRFYVLTALAIKADDWEFVQEQMFDLKRKVFNRRNVAHYEIKSNWLRQPKERARIDYLAKLSPEALTFLGDGLYEVILDQSCPKTIISIVINKDAMLKTYGQAAEHPNLYAYRLLLERISLFLNDKNENGIVICDRYANQTDDLLNQNHVHTHHAGGYSWKKLKNIKENLFFVDSKFNNLIQLADICSYNVFRAFRFDEPNYPYFQKILPLFRKVDGYSLLKVGLTVRPNPDKVSQPEISKILDFLKVQK